MSIPTRYPGLIYPEPKKIIFVDYFAIRIGNKYQYNNTFFVNFKVKPTSRNYLDAVFKLTESFYNENRLLDFLNFHYQRFYDKEAFLIFIYLNFNKRLAVIQGYNFISRWFCTAELQALKFSLNWVKNTNAKFLYCQPNVFGMN